MWNVPFHPKTLPLSVNLKRTCKGFIPAFEMLVPIDAQGRELLSKTKLTKVPGFGFSWNDLE